MKSKNRRAILVDELETRSMLSGFGSLFGHVPPPNAAVQADRALIRTDTAKLIADIQTLAPTLQADRAAIESAVDASTTVTAARSKLTADRMASATAIRNDFQAIRAAATGKDAQAAFAQLRTDFKAQFTTLQTDQAAVQSAIKADPGVVAARAKLTADSAPIAADRAKIQADYAQLFVDLKAEYGPKTPPPTA